MLDSFHSSRIPVSSRLALAITTRPGSNIDSIRNLNKNQGKPRFDPNTTKDRPPEMGLPMQGTTDRPPIKGLPLPSTVISTKKQKPPIDSQATIDDLKYDKETIIRKAMGDIVDMVESTLGTSLESQGYDTALDTPELPGLTVVDADSHTNSILASPQSNVSIISPAEAVPELIFQEATGTSPKSTQSDSTVE